ncbi:uncharacterized protein LOC125066992 isoform X1 [Vanessa atalanta]|uniref:uncharacterized protein LOC125066992 isoform X1 n=1 Tax=Vanessa atalanta TaxID=42275 RepID=UPI001FCD4D29|nr:uncharacterized protein LOC125066992 isoform X1 [Vanessa atalanta]
MALFPAYTSQEVENINIEDAEQLARIDYQAESTESQLLASDSEDDKARENLSNASKIIHQVQSNEEFYIDRKLDRGNLRVSTLYYPGRPQYECVRPRSMGAVRDRKRRYYARRATDAPDAPAVAERVSAYHLLVARDPQDVLLWERFIDFQEVCGGADAALETASEAAERAPHSGRLRARRLSALRAALSPHAYLERLRDMLAAEKSVDVRIELWEHLLRALAAAPGGDPAQLTAAACAALADTRALPQAYPRIFYCVGSYLRAGGLWERLVMSVELVVAMNYASAAFPPPDDPDLRERSERRLRDLEDKVAASGLPLSTRWVRVERARAAAHWRPAPPAARSPDPQRTPLPHDVADLLLPVAADDELLQLSVRLLLLAKVPLLPGTQWAARWAGDAAADGGEALLPLLREAHSLPAAHPARVPPELARRLLALLLDPPHYFSDDTGYLSWVNALWETCCARARGWVRAALVCWRLRWLHALLLAAGGEAEARAEAARIRSEARALLRRLDCASPLPFAEFARVELLAAGREAALRVAGRALRAALLDAACPPHHALYVARTVCEVSATNDGGQPSEEGACALVCAVLGRAPPSRLVAPSPEDLDAALQTCERQCASVESEAAAGEGAEGAEGSEGASAALLPGAGEWARARALLAPPPRRAELLRAVRDASLRAAAQGRGDASRYCEESACALTAAAAAEGRAAVTARLLSPLFPDNAYLALASAGAPLWARGEQSHEERLRALTPRSDVGAVASLLPALLAALRADFAPLGEYRPRRRHGSRGAR